MNRDSLSLSCIRQNHSVSIYVNVNLIEYFLLMLSSYINRDAVIRKLIKIRCKLADKRSEQMQVHDFVRFDKKLHLKTNKESTLIYSLFPSRSQWCHIGKRRHEMDSSKRNESKLLFTYYKAKEKDSREDWYINLCREADKIVAMAMNPVNGIPAPHVHVIEKKREKNTIICRPVCTFDLEVKIVISLYNKFLTNLFDNLFLSCSYAFRVPKHGDPLFQHTKAVKDIQRYRKQHIGAPLYVAECDMQKFYDTIDHRVIKARFNMLFSKAKKQNDLSTQECQCIKSWFYSYVDCFGFNEHVNAFNSRPSDKIWASIRNRKGCECKIKWVEALTRGNNRAARNKRRMLGVPQGGPLSGLIANIVMHFVDLAVFNTMKGKDMLFLRFCDDMILIGINKEEVEATLNTYNQSIKSARLYPHPHEDTEGKSAKLFWEGKSRGPYIWGEHGKNVFPWITFVGFDINWQGELRVRRASIEKHIIKQHSTVWDLLNQYHNHYPKYQQYSILSSLESRMIAMSVGHIGLWNYKESTNTHSWMAAFSILDKNPWSEKQMKLLDRHRNLELRRAKSYIWELTCPTRKMSGDHANKSQFYHGKPFSYYGQAFKEW